ncbi:hypothetical protein M7I_5295 [Glarea lozoyensis 74030]|uniref:Uncharacterized protein n=1 Tax=Glarea lozoyensis (strain ATCC 74030 / MF5533) TaxID=1104152 RepID=H0ERH6_GLAL7|nr:hypothetical protein M7I_5295 [Glarea lozoyensis 74030]
MNVLDTMSSKDDGKLTEKKRTKNSSRKFNRPLILDDWSSKIKNPKAHEDDRRGW